MVNFFVVDREPTLNIGEVATIDGHHRNTTPIPVPNKFADVFHGDIGYGCRTALWGIRYTILLVDRATRYKYIYPLHNLKDDIVLAFRQFLMDIGQSNSYCNSRKISPISTYFILTTLQ